MSPKKSKSRQRRRIRVRGIVQGVGFRPFVFRLAEEEGLSGWVLNDSLGVLCEVEGAVTGIESFERRLSTDAPPLARVTGVEAEGVPPTGESGFTIRASDAGDARTTLISPDVATCDDCLRELFDPNDRRYRYPFINCTNCGPRWTIIRGVPYDRPQTTMAPFEMCDECLHEYEDPRDRRFHAQPNACPVCGPKVRLTGAKGNTLHASDVVHRAAHFLHEGCVVAVKGLGGFHLACDASNDRAVRRLRERKAREEKPLAVMARSVPDVSGFAEVRPQDRRLLESPERPIVLLPQKPGGRIAASVAPHSRYFGVLLPYTPLHHLLLSEGFDALVMTSGNASDEPIARDNDEAMERLGGIADYFLLHDRDIHVTSDDSVVRADERGLRQMRRSRGYVPVPVPIPDGPVILAVGAELKNTVALTRGPFVFLSQHVGDVRNAGTHEFFLRTVDHLKTILAVECEIVAHDMHPDYLSTRFALELKSLVRVPVQHHHAHVASCMLEHGLSGRVIGVALDGTGCGTDGNTWGGEFLVADLCDFERAGRFEYLPLPGGDRAIVEPWRTAFSALVATYGDDWRTLDLDFLRRRDARDLETVAKMIAKRVNCPLSSGAGRVFDAVSALTGISEKSTYEGQPAVELEAAARSGIDDAYPFDVADGTQPPAAGQDACRVIHFARTYRGIVEDLGAGVPVGVISARFHNTVVEAVVEMVRGIHEKTRLNRVCLSGGVFQNRYLSDRVAPRLEALGLEVYEQSAVPANDGGIALGQAAVARARTSHP